MNYRENTRERFNNPAIMMKRVKIVALALVLVLAIVGCGEQRDKSVEVIGGADEPTSIYLNPGEDNDLPTGMWQTASIGYESDGEMQPEYYVEFDGLQVNYGHMKDDQFILDHTDEISYFEITAPGKYIIQAESEGGVQYTYQTSESDESILEYYETWNTEDFGDAYRGGASLSRCE